MNSEVISRIERFLPDLRSALRRYLQEDPLRREFQVDESPWEYEIEKDCIELYQTDIPGLFNKVRTLQNLELVRDVSRGRTKRYAITEPFADYLLETPADKVMTGTETPPVSPQHGIAVRKPSRSIGSGEAVKAVWEHMRINGLNATEFAIQAQTTEKTLRKFLGAGLVRRAVLDGIAKAMGLTREELLRGGGPP